MGSGGIDFGAGEPVCRDAVARPVATNSTTPWLERQKYYWDAVAPTYDLQYSTEWSAAENVIVARRLSTLLPEGPAPKVLDLGCGTGLGYGMLTELRPDMEYIGVDASAGMLDIFRSKFADDIQLLNEPVEGLLADRFHGIDLVIATFTSASYIDLRLRELLARVASWMKPSGCIYLSFLNRLSIGSMGALGFGRVIDYSSRGFTSGTVPAKRYTSRELIETCAGLGLSARTVSLGPFAGVFESKFFIRTNALLANYGGFGHTVDLMITGKAAAK
ncbi:hypothetical protein NRB20_54150 [Nocardia sp. RB20]|uniref:Methyltransferase domain-containing protein n=1 Tax=Nocardia macrotermitis TaxID=2585198 RepID=A0A7K0D950_9NOCA|nr:hypothetical protein [Nocardia macrotermitis]